MSRVVGGSVFRCFKQKTAYEMRISDWSSDVCASDLAEIAVKFMSESHCASPATGHGFAIERRPSISSRSEEHTSELQSLMRISYAVFCLKKKKKELQYRKQRFTSTYTMSPLETTIVSTQMQYCLLSTDAVKQ